jgi:hypothetical protein
VFAGPPARSNGTLRSCSESPSWPSGPTAAPCWRSSNARAFAGRSDGGVFDSSATADMSGSAIGRQSQGWDWERVKGTKDEIDRERVQECFQCERTWILSGTRGLLFAENAVERHADHSHSPHALFLSPSCPSTCASTHSRPEKTPRWNTCAENLYRHKYIYSRRLPPPPGAARVSLSPPRASS